MISQYLFFSGYTRVQNTHKPSLVCARALDRFTVSESLGNGKLIYPVGLLTADEMMLAGGFHEYANSSYYLYTNQNYWSISASDYDNDATGELYLYNTGAIKYHNSVVSYTNGLRPVVSLSKNTSVTSGDGTANNPYEIG